MINLNNQITISNLSTYNFNAANNLRFTKNVVLLKLRKFKYKPLIPALRLMHPKENLEKHGLQLPDASTPGGSYVSVNIRENIAYIAIPFPIRNEGFKY